MIQEKDIKNPGLRKAVQKAKGVYKLSLTVGIHPQRIYSIIRREKIPPLLAIRCHQMFGSTWKELGYEWPTEQNRGREKAA